MGLTLDIKKAEAKLKKIEKNFKNSKKILQEVGQDLNKDIRALFKS